MRNTDWSQSALLATTCISGALWLAGCAADAQAQGDPALAPAAPSAIVEPLAGSQIPDAPAPPKATHNPFAAAKLWVNGRSQAAEQAKALVSTAPEKAKVIERIANRPSAVWLGEWSGDVRRHVVDTMQATGGAMPVFVVYNLPYRDCGNHSKGGLAKADAYRAWIREVQAGLGSGRAAVIVEPDALGLLDKCLTLKEQAERLALVKDAVRALRQGANVAVYVDAGHPHWVPVSVMAERLERAGVADANGFALNVSNYVATNENNTYGDELSRLLGGAHYVIDTSRNGNGAAPMDEWCNPAGRKLGTAPTTETGNPLVDAWLWIKPPGESDGECNGGPRAGTFWVEQALRLAD